MNRSHDSNFRFDWGQTPTPDFRHSPLCHSRPNPTHHTLATPPTTVNGVVMSIFRKLRPRRPSAGALAIATAAAFFAPPVTAAHREPAAAAALDTAIARMGGQETLTRIERVRFETMTLWQRMTFETRPMDLIIAYELHSDLRNYPLIAWRNTRRFVNGPELQEMTDIVQKDAGIRRFPL